MADIFISYSSKDKEKADQLSELLASAGLSVWIDKKSIELSTSWSGEIADAIEQCRAFIILLSPNSAESGNVAKEVSLASHYKKKILPLDLEPVVLSRDLAYHLAGLHRAPMTNIDAIIRAIGKLGLEATQAPTLKIVKEIDSRKSLMILPFEDLSPTADNQWFTDGIVSELIQSLSNVKALKLMDAQTTKEFKNYRGQLTVYAKEMGVRYFVQGDVRKFGDNIKINSRLLDVETGDHLWQDSMKGTMNDIFDIQEKVAEKVLGGLSIILTKDEAMKVAKKPTENAEAYELLLKGNEYFSRQTRSDLDRALMLYEEAVRLDPNFAGAHIQIAHTSLIYYHFYAQEPERLQVATVHIEQAASVLGTSTEIYSIRSIFARNIGRYEEALYLALQAVALDPEYANAYDVLGFAYKALYRNEEAAAARKRFVQFQENNYTAHFNYIIALNELHDPVRLAEAALVAMRVYERHIRLTPDDLNARVEYANILQFAGENERALSEAGKLERMEGLDGAGLYDLACLYLDEGETAGCMRLLRRSVERGFSNIEVFHRDPDLDPLRGTEEFEALMKELEHKTAGE